MMPHREEEPNEEAEPNIEEETEEVASLKQSLDEEREKAEKYLASWQRAEADMANYKRHSDQEKQEIAQFSTTTLILNILPVLDDMERAFNALPAGAAGQEWLEGISMVERKLLNSLEAVGLSRIDSLGEPFDPNLHEAVRQDKGPDGVIIAEMQKGYKLRDRVIRPSKVVVGNGEEEAA